MDDPPWRRAQADSEPDSELGASAGSAAAKDADRAGAPEPKPQPREKKKKKDHVAAAMQAFVDGEREAAVRAWLEKKGLAPDEIEDVVTRARARISKKLEQKEAEHSAAYEEEVQAQRRKDLLYGALWFGGGLLLTVATCSAAQDAGGGRYVLAWGPMLYGGFRLLKAL
jgi:hypothetical protein